MCIHAPSLRCFFSNIFCSFFLSKGHRSSITVSSYLPHLLVCVVYSACACVVVVAFVIIFLSLEKEWPSFKCQHPFPAKKGRTQLALELELSQERKKEKNYKSQQQSPTMLKEQKHLQRNEILE